MKFSILSCACVLALTLCGVAHAAVISPTIDEVSGSLGKYSEMTFTYASNGTSPGPFVSSSGSESLSGTTVSSSSFSSSTSSPQSSTQTVNIDGGLLTVITTAAFKGSTTVTIENMTGFTAAYNILLAATNLDKAGNFTISSISPAPLPTAAIMFLTALMGLGLFGKLRQQNSI